MPSQAADITTSPDEAPRIDTTAARLLNLLFILNAARRPLPTSRIISDSDLGYGSANPASDERKFRRDRAKLAQQGIAIVEVREAGASETEESSWAIDRERTFAAGGLIERSDAQLLIRAIDEYLACHTTPLARPLRAVRAKAVEALATRAGELPALPSHDREQTDPVADAVWGALATRRRFVFSYRNAAGASSQRSVAIWGVFTVEGATYFCGHDDQSDAVRTFRVDRVEAVRAPGAAYEIPSGFSLSNQVFLPFDLGDGPVCEATYELPGYLGDAEVRSLTRGRGTVKPSEETAALIWRAPVRDWDAAADFALEHARDGIRPLAPAVLIETWKQHVAEAVSAHGA